MTPRTVAYKTLATVGSTVDGAMKVYAQAYTAGQVPSYKHVQITYLHDEKFNPAFEAAIIAARFNYETPAPTNVVALADTLLNAIYQILAPKTP